MTIATLYSLSRMYLTKTILNTLRKSLLVNVSFRTLVLFRHLIDDTDPRFHEFKEGLKFHQMHANKPPIGHDPHGGLFPKGNMRIVCTSAPML